MKWMLFDFVKFNDNFNSNENLIIWLFIIDVHYIGFQIGSSVVDVVTIVIVVIIIVVVVVAVVVVTGTVVALFVSPFCELIVE